MAPKRKPAAASKNASDDNDESLSAEGSDSDVGVASPATKKAKKPQVQKGSKKGTDDADTPKKETKPRKPAAPKAPKITEPTKCEDGWTLHPPSLIYRYRLESSEDSIVAVGRAACRCAAAQELKSSKDGPCRWRN